MPDSKPKPYTLEEFDALPRSDRETSGELCTDEDRLRATVEALEEATKTLDLYDLQPGTGARRVAEDALAEQRSIGHGEGQEHAIADVNAGRIDDLIAPRLDAAREEGRREGEAERKDVLATLAMAVEERESALAERNYALDHAASEVAAAREEQREADAQTGASRLLWGDIRTMPLDMPERVARAIRSAPLTSTPLADALAEEKAAFAESINEQRRLTKERDEARARVAKLEEVLRNLRNARDFRCCECGEPGTRFFRTEGDGPFWLCDKTDAAHGVECYSGEAVERPEVADAEALLKEGKP